MFSKVLTLSAELSNIKQAIALLQTALDVTSRFEQDILHTFLHLLNRLLLVVKCSIRTPLFCMFKCDHIVRMKEKC